MYLCFVNPDIVITLFALICSHLDIISFIISLFFSSNKKNQNSLSIYTHPIFYFSYFDRIYEIPLFKRFNPSFNTSRGQAIFIRRN